MLRLFQPKVSPEGLLASSLFDERIFYRVFIRDLKKCRDEVIIESPYMTICRAAILLPVLKKLVKRGVKVRIHTRFPNHHEELLRIQAWKVAKVFKRHGIRVIFYKNYNHRKIAVLDGRILWEGSLNILSQANSREVMRRIESEELAKQMVQFLRLNHLFW